MLSMKILVAIATWGTKNDQYLSRLVAEYRAMPFEVDIVVLTNAEKEVARGVKVVVPDLRGKSPWAFGFPHKEMFARQLNDYDLFIFSEDDTLVTERNLRAFLDVSAQLPEDEIPGFLRFEERPDGSRNFPEIHGPFHWEAGSVRTRSGYTLAFFTNEHAACYVLTQQQLRRAIASGGYLVEPHAEKYDLLCTAATDPYTQCGMQKVICISHLEDFLIHHLPNKYVGTGFGVGDSVLHKQVDALLRIGNNGHKPHSLFETGTKLKYASYSKNYYEPVRAEVLSAIPENTRTVLSIGCGWGVTEAHLVEKGLQVCAVPLDPVIPSEARGNGVEIVTGDFAEARNKLAGRQFDCLLLSNVLHLVPEPAAVLSTFGALLSPDGVIVAVVPNTVQLGATWKSMRGEGRIEPVGRYEKTGVQSSSRRTVRNWFREAGMRVEEFNNLLRPRARNLSRITLGLIDPWIAFEFIAIAKKA